MPSGDTSPGAPKPGLPEQVPSDWYDREYYLRNMEGGEIFRSTAGRKVTPRHAKLLEIASVRPGERVLDIGCGRGELVLQAGLKGAVAKGVDYSSAAIDLAKEALATYDEEYRSRVSFAVGDAVQLTGADERFDKVFFVDVAEHLHPHELESALRTIRELLSPDGRLILHTAPNLLFYRYAYPVIRALYPLIRRIFPAAAALARTKPNWQGDTLPKNPEEGQGYNERVHVNEQTPFTLKNTLRKCGFDCRLHMIPFLRQVDSASLRVLYSTLAMWPWSYIGCAEIVAVCRRRR
ncbi:MAG: class I SAM-dependent methyltransferase [Armatimonadetes bacterium]|nr:class I SAM-dependent methyltransferase [Armatimonadota bacterium]HOC31793.1 class I SAM-dependent methyltransferase [Armatimonadota bacterium]